MTVVGNRVASKFLESVLVIVKAPVKSTVVIPDFVHAVSAEGGFDIV